MCFFAKKKYVSAIACLKKALYFGPFEWTVTFNLGLIHLTIGQNASAFHFFSASVNINPNFGQTYMYLGITLNRLDDFENACGAFEKALQIEATAETCINYAIVLHNREDHERGFVYFTQFESIWGNMDEEARQKDPQILVSDVTCVKSVMTNVITEPVRVTKGQIQFINIVDLIVK
jgi:Bardet-Biedl syndrome 4 protein